MKTKNQLIAERRSHISAARKIADGAESEGRDFTAIEQKTVEAHLGEARLLSKQIDQLDPEDTEQRQKERDQDIYDQISELSKGMPGGVDRGAGGSVAKAGPWSKAFLANLNPANRKEFLTPSGGVGVPSLSATIPAAAERLETILQAFMPFTPLGEDGKGGGGISYLREVTRTHAAAAVADGEKKPQSTYELEEIQAPAETIAHLTEPIKRRYFDDYANLRRYLDTVLRQGVQLALEDEVINGSGVSPHLSSLLNTAGINVYVNPVDGNWLIAARGAQTILENQSLPIDGMFYAMNPDTWETLETLRTTVGNFEMNIEGGRQGVPINRTLRQLWGVPVVPAVSVPAYTAILWHRSAVELSEREGVRIEWSENVTTHIDGSPVTDFERNMLRFRAEGRYVLALYKPSAIVEILFEAGS